ncbi:MAG: hypothetical protein LAT65_16240 [Saccharospirillum sp.]|nr:hypothetical protein [Saccharospirillum sp.]
MTTLLTLTQPLTDRQQQLLQLWLQPEDHLLVREDARTMARVPCPFALNACIRAEDAARIGGILHPDWQVIDDAAWVSLVEQNQPVVTW